MSDHDTLIRALQADGGIRTLCMQSLPPEYGYASLSTMLLDAIFSIGVRYEQVQALVERHARIACFNACATGPTDPYPLTRLIERGRRGTPEQFADQLGNRCRTSSRSGILKAEAVLLAAEALVAHGIEDLPSWRAAGEPTKDKAKSAFRAIKGQGSGISWDYLSMLAGDSNKVKSDRMVVRYVERAIGRAPVQPAEAACLLRAAASALRHAPGFPPHLSPRLLDYAIWSTERDNGRASAAGRSRRASVRCRPDEAT